MILSWCHIHLECWCFHNPFPQINSNRGWLAMSIQPPSFCSKNRLSPEDSTAGLITNLLKAKYNWCKSGRKAVYRLHPEIGPSSFRPVLLLLVSVKKRGVDLHTIGPPVAPSFKLWLTHSVKVTCSKLWFVELERCRKFLWVVDPAGLALHRFEASGLPSVRCPVVTWQWPFAGNFTYQRCYLQIQTMVEPVSEWHWAGSVHPLQAKGLVHQSRQTSNVPVDC